MQTLGSQQSNQAVYCNPEASKVFLVCFIWLGFPGVCGFGLGLFWFSQLPIILHLFTHHHTRPKFRGCCKMETSQVPADGWGHIEMAVLLLLCPSEKGTTSLSSRGTYPLGSSYQDPVWKFLAGHLLGLQCEPPRQLICQLPTSFLSLLLSGLLFSLYPQSQAFLSNLQPPSPPASLHATNVRWPFSSRSA